MNKILEIPEWQSDYLESLMAIALFTIGYVLYYFVSHSDILLTSYKKKYGEERGLTRFIWMTRYFGSLSIGVIPAVIVLLISDWSPAQYGLSFNNTYLSLVWIVCLLVIVLPVTFINSRKPESFAFHPFVREKHWTGQMIAHNAFTWVVYLFGYELMFRGILLFATVPIMGAWPAIILNTAFYALVHMPKSRKETISAVPFGIVLCLITLTTGTFWVAFIVHCGLALGTFFFSLKFNPEMKIV